jgi:hypothetical protein
LSGSPASAARIANKLIEKRRYFLFILWEEEEIEIIRLPWRGQYGRAAAARALCACCAAGYAKGCTGSPVCF